MTSDKLNGQYTDNPDYSSGKLDAELYHYLRSQIEFALEDCGFKAQISPLRLAEAVYHWQKDIARLSENQDDGVNPAKYISYFSFWIRKIKPINDAFHAMDITYESEGACAHYTKEVTDINERISLFLAMSQLLAYAKNGQLDGVDPNDPDPRVGGIIAQRVLSLKSFFVRFMNFSADVGATKGSNYASLVYDMRYRTFGPHHLTTWLNQAIFASQPTSS